MMNLSRRVFSGIQPTGVPHLGNYFGAISEWIKLTRQPDLYPDPIYCIVDVHGYTSQRVIYGKKFYDNILSTTASLLALGLDPQKCILFRQSDVLEHSYLDNVLDNFVSPHRLARMTQYKEKAGGSSHNNAVNGLLNYPVLQAADILLYRANLVPVGEDQTQHLELTRDIAKKFNASTDSDLFPEPVAYLSSLKYARRIKSLRDPSRKMSKSDPNTRSTIEVVDEPEVILDKIKKAVTDSESTVYFNSDKRPGVSNLMHIHHLITNETMDQIASRCSGIDTGQYKLRLADMVIEKFRPTREEYKRIRNDREYLEQILRLGHDKAKPLAVDTIKKVKHLLGSYRETID